MSLVAGEVVVGAVAYLDPAGLYLDPSVACFGPSVTLPDGSVGVSPIPNARPFVCVEADGTSCTWAPITNQQRDEYSRLKLRAQWIVDGYGKLGSGKSYLQDGAVRLSGPVGAFVAAGSGEGPFASGRRPHVTADGIKAIKAEIAGQQHRAVQYVP